MDKKECVKKDLKVLDAFYKEYFSKSHIQLGYWICAGMLLTFLVCACWFPYQSFTTEDLKDFSQAFPLLFLMGAIGSVQYLQAYRLAYNKKGMVVGMAQYLQYLPISAKARKEYLFRKLLKLQWKIYAVAQTGQIVFSLITGNGLGWCNFGYPVLAALVIPVVLSSLTIVIRVTVSK